MWLLQTLNNKYETDITFRVNVSGLPGDVELDNDDTYFMARLRDDGTKLLGYELRGALPLEVEYNELDYSNGSLVLPLSVAKQKIEAVIGSSSSLVRLLQDTLLIDIKREMAVMPVKIDGVIDVADHFVVTDVEVVPSEVNVYATEAGLEGVNEVRTEYVVKKYLKNSVGFKAKLMAGELMTVEPSEVDVYVTVQPLVNRSVSVPVNYIGFPANYNAAKPDEVELSYEVPETDAESIGAGDFVVSLDYKDIVLGNGRAEFTVQPASHKVSNIKVKPSYIINR